MKKSIQKLLMAAFVMAATLILAPSVDAKAYGITQVNPATDSITMTWTAKEDAVAYNVYVGEDYSTATLCGQLPATSTSATITGLLPGSEYYVAVKYLKLTSSGTTSEYAVGSEYDARTVPTVVTGLNQDRWWYYIKVLDVKWDNVESADSYEYEIRNAKGKKVASGTSTYPNCELRKVSNKMVYQVRVRATSTICGQTFTTPWTNWAYCFHQPMIKGRHNGGSISISWGKITGATGYDVYVSAKKDSGYKKVKSLGKNKTSYTITKCGGKKIKSNKKYYVYVVAKKKVGKTTYDSGLNYTWSFYRR